MTLKNWSLITCATTITMLISACPQMQQGGPEGARGGMMGPPPVAVVVQPVQMIDYAPALDLVGEIRASQRAVMTAEVGGRVTMISHRVGEEHSKSSGTLIQIDPSSYQAAVAAATAQLAQATETLSKAKTGARSQEVSAQRAQTDAARATHRQAVDNLERQRKLYLAGVISESMMVAAELQAEAAAAGLEAAEQVLDSIEEGTREEDIAAAAAMVLVAESGVRSAQLNLGRTSVSVPFNAVVTGLFVEVGSFVGPGTPMVEIVSTGPGEAWFNLPEGEAATVSAGDEIELRSDSLPGEVFSGEVISVSPAADMGTRQFPMRVAITDLRFKAGMAVDGRLLKGTPVPSVFISSDATVMGPLGVVAYVMLPSATEGELPGVEMIPVVTGETIDDMVVVIEGNLQPGQMVVTRGNEQLYPGAKIIPTNMMGEGGMGGAPGGAPPGMEGAEGANPAEGSGQAEGGPPPDEAPAEPADPEAH